MYLRCKTSLLRHTVVLFTDKILAISHTPKPDVLYGVYAAMLTMGKRVCSGTSPSGLLFDGYRVYGSRYTRAGMYERRVSVRERGQRTFEPNGAMEERRQFRQRTLPYVLELECGRQRVYSTHAERRRNISRYISRQSLYRVLQMGD